MKSFYEYHRQNCTKLIVFVQKFVFVQSNCTKVHAESFKWGLFPSNAFYTNVIQLHRTETELTSRGRRMSSAFPKAAGRKEKHRAITIPLRVEAQPLSNIRGYACLFTKWTFLQALSHVGLVRRPIFAGISSRGKDSRGWKARARGERTNRGSRVRGASR